MNRTIVVIAVILAAALVAGFYVWSSHNRFYIMTGAQGGVSGRQEDRRILGSVRQQKNPPRRPTASGPQGRSASAVGGGKGHGECGTHLRNILRQDIQRIGMDSHSVRVERDGKAQLPSPRNEF